MSDEVNDWALDEARRLVLDFLNCDEGYELRNQVAVALAAAYRRGVNRGHDLRRDMDRAAESVAYATRGSHEWTAAKAKLEAIMREMLTEMGTLKRERGDDHE